jgi:hypothetical protein
VLRLREEIWSASWWFMRVEIDSLRKRYATYFDKN